MVSGTLGSIIGVGGCYCFITTNTCYAKVFTPSHTETGSETALSKGGRMGDNGAEFWLSTYKDLDRCFMCSCNITCILRLHYGKYLVNKALSSPIRSVINLGIFANVLVERNRSMETVWRNDIT